MTLRRAFGVRRARDESVHEVHGHVNDRVRVTIADQHNSSIEIKAVESPTINIIFVLSRIVQN